MDGSLGIRLEIGLALRRERLAEADRGRKAREAAKSATPLVVVVVAAIRRRIGLAKNSAQPDWTHDLTAHFAMLSMSTPR